MSDKAMPRVAMSRGAVAGMVLAFAVAAAGMTSAAAQPAGAERPAPSWRDTDGDKSAGELAREGFQKFLQALEGAARAIPQYALPEINENGDIIIRRKYPPAETPPRLRRDFDDPEMDRTSARDV